MLHRFETITCPSSPTDQTHRWTKRRLSHHCGQRCAQPTLLRSQRSTAADTDYSPLIEVLGNIPSSGLYRPKLRCRATLESPRGVLQCFLQPSRVHDEEYRRNFERHADRNPCSIRSPAATNCSGWTAEMSRQYNFPGLGSIFSFTHISFSKTLVVP